MAWFMLHLFLFVAIPAIIGSVAANWLWDRFYGQRSSTARLLTDN